MYKLKANSDSECIKGFDYVTASFMCVSSNQSSKIFRNDQFDSSNVLVYDYSSLLGKENFQWESKLNTLLWT